MISREDFADFEYSARCWIRGIAWTPVIAGLLISAGAYMSGQTSLAASSLTAAIFTLWPSPRFSRDALYEVILTALVRRGMPRPPHDDTFPPETP